ncbi:MAG: NAD(+)/NADH kinase, partial [Desulfobacterales bacterium]
MKSVGIIANPASGKDIRRLVAYGSVVTSNEKINMLKRILLGIDSMGIKDVSMMPDASGIGNRALDRLPLSMNVSFLDMILGNNQDDSTRAAEQLNRMGVACIVTLGGDGTNRVVAKSSGTTPLLSVATGTNNAFCTMAEGTLAGIAAGVIAQESGALDEVVIRAPRLEIWDDTGFVDSALVDVVISKAEFVGSRAIWDEATLSEVFLTRAEPGNIGFSSLGGYLCHVPADAGKGLYIAVGPGGQTVRAPIAPGRIRPIPVESFRIFEAGEKLPVRQTPAVIALDGEREIVVAKGDRYYVSFSPDGPYVVDLTKTLNRASK